MPTRYTTKGSKSDKHGWSIDGGEAHNGPYVGEDQARRRSYRIRPMIKGGRIGDVQDSESLMYFRLSRIRRDLLPTTLDSGLILEALEARHNSL
jgi:hypothetical protein